MSEHCSDTHGYLEGRKTANGEAFYDTTVGPRAVVFGATPSHPALQININDVPDGATLKIYDRISDAHLELKLNKDHLQGRHGRSQFNYDRISAAQGPAAAMMYLDGAYHSLPDSSVGESVEYTQKVLDTVIACGTAAQVADLSTRISHFQNASKDERHPITLNPADVQKSLLTLTTDLVTTQSTEDLRIASLALGKTLALAEVKADHYAYGTYDQVDPDVKGAAYDEIDPDIRYTTLTAFGELLLANPTIFDDILPQIMHTGAFDQHQGSSMDRFNQPLCSRLYHLGFEDSGVAPVVALEAQIEYRRDRCNSYEYDGTQFDDEIDDKIAKSLFEYANSLSEDAAVSPRVAAFVGDGRSHLDSKRRRNDPSYVRPPGPSLSGKDLIYEHLIENGLGSKAVPMVKSRIAEGKRPSYAELGDSEQDMNYLVGYYWRDELLAAARE